MLNQMRNPADAKSGVELVFHALSDANRRRMIDQLTMGPASVSELARPLGISLPAVVQHLHVLEASGLVESQKVGRVRTCAVRAQALSEAERWINARRLAWEQSLDRLGDYLEGTAENPKSRSRP
jgi:DNA-binding transcriptional ArsR family regulator